MSLEKQPCIPDLSILRCEQGSQTPFKDFWLPKSITWAGCFSLGREETSLLSRSLSL